MSESTDTKRQLFTFEHDASRLELLVRILYWILIGIILWVYGMIAFICLFIQWFHILILGSRNEWFSSFAKGYLEYLVNVMGYTYIMTDKRLEIFPVAVTIYEE
ncbi:MAG: DUF4389 domain-containing protein [Methanoregula sp.]|jgi:hypothetical protein